MQAEEDFIVVVIGSDDEDSQQSSYSNNESKYSTLCSQEVEDIIKTAEEHGEYVTVKTEKTEYNSEQSDYEEIKIEYDEDSMLDNNEDGMGYIPENCYVGDTDGEEPGFVSFVAELRQKYEDLREDEELLITTLAQIMKKVKRPAPPQDYYVMNGIQFECVECGIKSNTIPAASRHYQEKHGERFFPCFACGKKFKSTWNWYKHEKRCQKPDADIVLKARALFLGRKGRSRPYLNENSKFVKTRTKYPCELCSATFWTKSTLVAHMNLHRGERPYVCKQCCAAYTSSFALKRHMKTTHTDIQYICDHCKRSFKSKPSLVTHMDTHNPIRKFGCDLCTRRYANKAALLLHVDRIHLNLPPPCACQICPKRYPRMSLLKTHMKKEHGLSIITRKMFLKQLPKMTKFQMQNSKVIINSILAS